MATASRPRHGQSRNDNVSVLLGNGDGTFQNAANFGTGSVTSPGVLSESSQNVLLGRRWICRAEAS